MIEFVRPDHSADHSFSHPWTVVGIGAGVHEHFGFAGDQSTVAFDAGLDAQPRRMAPRRQHRLGHALNDPHRTAAGLARDGDREGFDFEIGLAPVGAADIGNDHLDFGVRVAEHMRQLGAHQKRMRRGTPQRDTSRVHLSHRAMRLHGVLINHRETISLVDDLIGAGEGLVRIAFGELFAMADIAAENFADAGDIVKFAGAGLALVHERRAFSPRRIDVADTGQFLVLHVDQRQCLFGDQSVFQRLPPPPVRRRSAPCPCATTARSRRQLP